MMQHERSLLSLPLPRLDDPDKEEGVQVQSPTLVDIQCITCDVSLQGIYEAWLERQQNTRITVTEP